MERNKAIVFSASLDYGLHCIDLIDFERHVAYQINEASEASFKYEHSAGKWDRRLTCTYNERKNSEIILLKIAFITNGRISEQHAI